MNGEVIMQRKIANGLWCFVQLMFAAFCLYFLAVGLAEPTGELLRYFNDRNNDIPATGWAVFVPGVVIGAVLWSALWVWFKASEKCCIEALKRHLNWFG
jgi:hypothetical protein